MTLSGVGLRTTIRGGIYLGARVRLTPLIHSLGHVKS